MNMRFLLVSLMRSILCLILPLIVSGSIVASNDKHKLAMEALRSQIRGLKADHSGINADKVMGSRSALDILLGKDTSNRMEEINIKKADEENEDIQVNSMSIFNIYKGLPCEDTYEACTKFQPLCPIFPRIGHLTCRKSCHVCGKDRPNWQKLNATFPQGTGTISFLQESPDSTVFAVLCLSKQKFSKFQNVSLMIHTSAVENCTNIGPVFDPFQSCPKSEVNGYCTGNLGNFTLTPAESPISPKIWPSEIPRCPTTDGWASYKLLNNHLDLFGGMPLEHRSIVVHFGRQSHETEEATSGSANPQEMKHQSHAMHCAELVRQISDNNLKVASMHDDPLDQSLDFEDWKSHWLIRKNGSEQGERETQLSSIDVSSHDDRDTTTEFLELMSGSNVKFAVTESKHLDKDNIDDPEYEDEYIEPISISLDEAMTSSSEDADRFYAKNLDEQNDGKEKKADSPDTELNFNVSTQDPTLSVNKLSIGKKKRNKKNVKKHKGDAR